MNIIFNLTNTPVNDELKNKGVVKVSPELEKAIHELLDCPIDATATERDDRAHDAANIAVMHDCYHDIYTFEEKNAHSKTSGIPYDPDYDYECYPHQVLLDPASPLFQNLVSYLSAYGASIVLLSEI